MGYDSLEVTPEGISLDPEGHVAAIGGAEGDSSRGINVGEMIADVVETEFEVDIRAATPLVLDSVGESLPEGGRARWVERYNDISLLGIDC